jgi:Aldehyde dehydrogenase family
MEKKTQVVAILGAGNYSGPVEIIKAIFFNNCVAVHKPHPLNSDVDRVWERVLDPLVKAGCLAYCSADQGPDLTKHPRVEAIYFTGGAGTARAIAAASGAALICESGGVNPTVLVPGDRRWTESELRHHAMQLVTLGKLNGGHACARSQLIVTCKNWPQRGDFLRHVEAAIRDTTFAAGSYYPGTAERMEGFRREHPGAKRIQPEKGKWKSADVLLVTGASEDAYGCQNEAFCQVFIEVPLDTEANAAAFLPYATKFCNDKAAGSLCAHVVIDGKTRKKNEQVLQTAITDLKYGSLGINMHPAISFLSQYLIWGGNEEGKPLVSGNGHFGNVFGFENVEKSST